MRDDRTLGMVIFLSVSRTACGNVPCPKPPTINPCERLATIVSISVSIPP